MGTVINLPPESFVYNAKKHQIIIDVREDLTESPLRGAFHFQYKKALQLCTELKTNLPLFILFSNGKKSGRFARKLAEKGFNIYKLRGGYQAWKRYDLKNQITL